MSGQYESSPLGTSTTDAVMRAVRAAAGSHEVIGELGRHADGRVAFLARDRSSGELTILQLTREPADPENGEPLELSELRMLDASVPAPDGTCHFCHAPLLGWERHCPACGRDVTGVSQDSAPGTSREEILDAVREATSGTYDILGDLPRADGGGSVFFARESASGRLVALRLLRESTAGGDAPAYSLGVTQLLKPQRPPSDAPRAPSAPAPASASASASAPAPEAAKVCPQCGSEYAMDVRFCPNDGVALRVISDGDGLVGQILADRYSVLRKLGEGGMGEVYLGEHVKMGRQCAIKVMRAAMTNDPAASGRFGREAANASRINHPNVAIVYDFGETEDGIVYIAMELVDGEPLSTLIAREKPLPVARAAEICRQVAEALGAAHELGIVHRDLKPDNIMIVTKDGRDQVKVVDFGIAKAMQSGGTRLTRTGFVLGTPAYMSPEQIAGDQLDGRTDLYSLGCILFELLTGDVTFGGSSAETIISRRLSEPPPHPRELNDAVPLLLDDIVVAALARSPADRFQTAADLATALVQFTPSGERAVTSTAAALPEAVRRVSGERARRAGGDAQHSTARTWLRITGIVCALAVVAAAFVWEQHQRSATGQVSEVLATASGDSANPAAKATTTDPAAGTAAGNAPAALPAASDSSVSDQQPVAPTTKPPASKARPAEGDTTQTPQTRAVPTPPDRRQRRPPKTPPRRATQQPESVAIVPHEATQHTPTSPPIAAAPSTSSASPPAPTAAQDDNAQVALVTNVLGRYVTALNDRQVGDMRTLYPAMSDRERDGFAALFKSATDLSATPAGNPSVSVDGADATADFGYTLAFYLPSQGQQRSQFRWHATLHRGPSGWRLQTLVKAP